MSKILFLSSFILLVSFSIQAQNVVISETTATADSSALLDLQSNERGFLLPRMTTDQRDSINNPAEALMIFNSTTKCLEIFVMGWHSIWCDGSFSCGSTITDVHGKIYNTVQIGTQCWMKENLAVRNFNDGSPIALEPVAGQWYTYSTPIYCWPGGDSLKGGLYNWYVVDSITNGGKNVCPLGWRIPTDNEWYIFENHVDATINNPTTTGFRGVDGGTKLKKVAPAWDGSGTDDFGFSSIETGFIYGVSGGGYQSATVSTRYWNAEEYSVANAWYRGLATAGGNTPKINRNNMTKKCGFSIRCIKD